MKKIEKPKFVDERVNLGTEYWPLYETRKTLKPNFMTLIDELIDGHNDQEARIAELEHHCKCEHAGWNEQDEPKPKKKCEYCQWSLLDDGSCLSKDCPRHMKPKEQEECKCHCECGKPNFVKGWCQICGLEKPTQTADQKWEEIEKVEIEPGREPFTVDAKLKDAADAVAQTECEHPTSITALVCQTCHAVTDPALKATPSDKEQWQPMMVVYETVANKWAIRAGEFETKEEAIAARDAIQKLLRGDS